MTAHAYCFHGQEYIGKKAYALEFARTLAHENDIMVIGTDLPAGQAGIDAIRDAKHFLSLSPLCGDKKVVIIDKAHTMQEEAQNALLKILEEPPASATIILVTSQLDALLPTVRSRVEERYFSPPSKEKFFEYLRDKKLSADQQEFLYQFTNASIGLVSQTENIKAFISEYSVLAKANLDQKFTMAKKLSEDDTLQQKVLFWMLYLRSKKMYKPLAGLLALYKTVSQPQFNKQLALENFMLSL